MEDFSMQYLTTDEILAQIDIEKAKQIHKETWCSAPVNAMTPWPYGNPPLGTWRLDPTFGDLDILLHLPLNIIQMGEPEDMIKYWEGYPLYVKWAKEGIEPPAIGAVRHVDGHLVHTTGRRRRLAAIDAGQDWIPAWFSETDLKTGRPLWEAQHLGTVHAHKFK